MNTVSNTHDYMEMALSYARQTGLETLPNPRVGAVLVKDDSIVGYGWTQAYGGFHAEYQAIQSAGSQAKGATLYCTLEPCHGIWEGKKQAPCTKHILEAGIVCVHIACLDSNAKIQGRGVAFLQSHGIAVHIQEKYTREARVLNEVFEYTQYCQLMREPSIRKHLPFVHLKIAETADGFMTQNRQTALAITGLAVQKKVHRMRANHQVLITSANTINIDNPHYTVRAVEGANPCVCIIDSALDINIQSHILQTRDIRRAGLNERGVIIATTKKGYANKKKRMCIEHMGVRVIVFENETQQNTVSLVLLLEYFIEHSIYAVMVEAGPSLSAGFLDVGLVSKISIMTSSKKILCGIGISDFASLETSALLSNLRQGIRDGNTPWYQIHSEVGSEGDMVHSGYMYPIFDIL